MSVQLTPVQPRSTSEVIVHKIADTVMHNIVYGKGAPVILRATERVGQACLDNPPIVVVGAIAAIAAKELAPHVT